MATKTIVLTKKVAVEVTVEKRDTVIWVVISLLPFLTSKALATPAQQNSLWITSYQISDLFIVDKYGAVQIT